MFKRFLQNLKFNAAIGRAYVAGIGQPGKLAPGELDIDDSCISNDQFYLVKKRRKYGDKFKIWWGGKITTCIVGHTAAQQFLASNEANLQDASIDMTQLFPLGFLRGLEGAEHTKYRSLFLNAFRAVRIKGHEQSIRTIINRSLSLLCQGDGRCSGEQVGRAMKDATTAIMIELILGIKAGSDKAKKLTKAYNEYAPNGMPIVIRDEQKTLYLPIKVIVENHVKSLTEKTDETGSLLGNIVQEGKLDETVVGNLIHMAEFARFDVHGLWRWVLLEISNHPDYLKNVAAEKDPEVRKNLIGSVGAETLRMQQSEFIYRSVTKTFSYLGILFPRRTRVRICIWEGHRDPNIFENPDLFEPGRFVNGMFGAGLYAPLGMGQHSCLGANWTMNFSRILVEELAEHYDLKQINYGTPKKGHFHFEPGSDSVLLFRKKLIS